MNRIKQIAGGLLYYYAVSFIQGNGEDWLTQCREHGVSEHMIEQMRGISPNRLAQWAFHPEQLQEAIENLPEQE